MRRSEHRNYNLIDQKMTVSNTTNKTTALGNGVTTVFNFPFKIFAAANLEVYLIDNTSGVATLQVLNTNYTVSINTTTEGGAVTFISGAPATGKTVFIKRVLDFTQSTDIPTESNFPEEAVEDRFDYLTMLSIQIQEEISRTIRLSETSSQSNIIIDDLVANKIVVVSSDGLKLQMSTLDFVDIEDDLAKILEIKDEIVEVADNMTDVVEVADNMADINAIAAVLAELIANLPDIENAASFGFPTLAAGDEGKVLRVNAARSGYIAQTIPNKNALINGEFLLHQYGTPPFTSVANNAFTFDRWKYNKSGAMVHDIAVSSDVPTVAQAGKLFTQSAQISCTTSDTSIAAGDYCTFSQTIEGVRFLPFAQQVLNYSFWFKATKTGVYCVSLSSGVKSYVGEFTVIASDTWEFKTVTVVASPSSGISYNIGGLGVIASFVLVAGSTYQTTGGAWQTGNYRATANQVNACDSTSNVIKIVGTALVVGSVPTGFEPLSYDQHLRECRRYYQKISLYASGVYGGATGNSEPTVSFPYLEEMCKVPSVSAGAATGNASDGENSFTVTGIATLISRNTTGAQIALAQTGTSGGSWRGAIVRNVPIILDAEI